MDVCRSRSSNVAFSIRLLEVKELKNERLDTMRNEEGKEITTHRTIVYSLLWPRVLGLVDNLLRSWVCRL